MKKYWIRLNRVAHGPYTASEIAATFGPSLPSNIPCSIVGEYKWSTLGDLIPEIGSAPAVAEEPEVNELSDAQNRALDSMINRAAFAIYAIVLMPVIIPLVYVMLHTKHYFAGAFGLLFVVAAVIFIRARFHKIADANKDLTFSQVLLVSIYIRRREKYANPFTEPPTEAGR